MYGISVNTSQQKQNVETAAAGGSPRIGGGSPRVAAGGSPRVAAGGSPRVAAGGSPRVAADSPRIAGGSPRIGADSSPRTSASPRHYFESPKARGSPKSAEVGEIDTRAPFQSVKAAMSLFGETGASPRSPAAFAVKKTNKSPEERVVEKESQLHMALNQLDAYKVQLRNSEATKAEALRDLEEARRTLQQLSAKIGAINPSDPPTRTDAPQPRETDPPHINNNNNSIPSAAELNSVKQQIAQLRLDFDAAMEAKTTAIQKASRAQNSAVVNRERVIELSKEVATLREALAKLTSLQSQEEEHEKAIAAKQESLKSLQKAKEVAEAKMQAINEEFHPDLTQHLELKLDETNKEIEVLREKLKNAKSADLNAWKTAASELETAKKAMQEVVALENSLRSQVDSLQQELENNPDKSKNNNNPSKEELRASIKEDTKDDDDSDYIASKILQLTSEAELAIKEAEEMKIYAESFRKEAEIARVAAKEAEEKLESMLKEARTTCRLLVTADSSSRTATGEVADPPAISKLNGKIKLSKDEYESLKKKTEPTTKKLSESKSSKRMSMTNCHPGCFN
nr:WEB family protein At1g12150-like [Ipomoea batatas]